MTEPANQSPMLTSGTVSPGSSTNITQQFTAEAVCTDADSSDALAAELRFRRAGGSWLSPQAMNRISGSNTGGVRFDERVRPGDTGEYEVEFRCDDGVNPTTGWGQRRSFSVTANL